MKDAVFSAIDRKTEKYVSVWKRFSELESPTLDKAGVDLASEYIAALGEKLVDFTRRLWETVPVYLLSCTVSHRAVKLVYNTLFEEETT
jgi:hypothetical protein